MRWSRLVLTTKKGTNTDADLLCVAALYWPADRVTELVIGRHRTPARHRARLETASVWGGGWWVAGLQSTPTLALQNVLSSIANRKYHTSVITPNKVTLDNIYNCYSLQRKLFIQMCFLSSISAFLVHQYTNIILVK